MQKLKLFFVFLLASFLSFCSWAAAATIQADVVAHWNGAAREVVTTNNIADTMNAGTYGYSGGWGFTYYPERERFSIVERTNSLEWPFSITVSNLPWTSVSSTNWVRAQGNAGNGMQGIGLYIPGPYASQYFTNAVISGFVMFGFDTGTYGPTDFLMMLNDYGSTGASVFTSSENLQVNAHGFLPESTYGATPITTTPWKDYYFTFMRLTRAGYGRLALYDPANNYAVVGNTVAATATNVYPMSTISLWIGYLNERPGSIYWGPMFVVYEPTDEEVITLFNPTFVSTYQKTIGGIGISLGSGVVP